MAYIQPTNNSIVCQVAALRGLRKLHGVFRAIRYCIEGHVSGERSYVLATNPSQDSQQG